ncbi:PAS domain-containing protein [Pseudorhodoferax sp. Leaf267]|uniref:PAS domain-containing sensor histidine kinase n=1 Tax=Pseudorhodoferax sp. Leaf267 TaxID=1736316 RepID=UPI0007138D81|nr:PAS domain-containing protein [Pseudorhodoferax sp. Leaf267]KQP17647.1 hypothetical protein ASF43_07085 [Pseudorhodoferax sp. Leaf267]
MPLSPDTLVQWSALAPAVLWGALLIAAALLVTTWLWWSQRSRLRRAREEASTLRAQFRQLQDRHELLATAVHKSPLVPYRCEARVGGPVLFVGDAIEQLCGWPAEAFTAQGKLLDDIVHPEDLDALRGRLRQALGEGTGLRFECRVLHRDGRCFWVHGHSDLRRTHDGRVFIEGAFLSIDERKALEHQLYEREHLYSSLIASIRGAAYRCTPDENWTVIFISDVIEQLSGWRPADYQASATLLREFIHAEDQAMVHRRIQDTIAQGQGYTLEYRAVHRDGRQFWAWEQGNAVRNASGEVVWLDGVIIDISERKAMEIALRDAKEQAEEAAASKTLFLANMGHEVRTPLNAIIGFSEIVLKTSLDALQREHVYKVRQAARALLKLVNDVLDMAKLERGQLTLAAGDFSLHELAHDAVQTLRPLADRRGLALQLDIDRSLPQWFHGDAPRLRQVLDKLLDNAVKFTERGSVRLQLGTQDGRLLLAVHDTGIGIAPDRQDCIFEAFTQADPSMSRRYGGVGLGITIAQQLVRHMGGSLGVQSTPGVGSSFRVLVPLAPAAHAQPAQALRPAAAPLQAVAAEPEPRPHRLDRAAAPLALPESVRQAIHALRSGDHPDATLPELLHLLRGLGLAAQAAQVESALAMFDLDRAAELLETLPARL